MVTFRKMDVMVFLVTALALGTPFVCARRDLLESSGTSLQDAITGETGLDVSSTTIHTFSIPTSNISVPKFGPPSPPKPSLNISVPKFGPPSPPKPSLNISVPKFGPPSPPKPSLNISLPKFGPPSPPKPPRLETPSPPFETPNLAPQTSSPPLETPSPPPYETPNLAPETSSSFPPDSSEGSDENVRN